MWDINLVTDMPDGDAAPMVGIDAAPFDYVEIIA